MEEQILQSPHAQNRRSWNAVTSAHQSHKGSQAAFFRDGGSTLFEEEQQLIGFVDGLRIAHLQCNCGQDSLSIARLGAQVVGCDISDAAIQEAMRLSSESGIACRFEREDVITWLEQSSGADYDIVFCSYGCISWISDLPRWARGIAAVLKPSGRFVLLEFHPLAWSFGENASLTGDPYFGPARAGGTTGVISWAGVPDYVAQSGDGLIPDGMEFAEGESAFANPEPAVEFTHTTADIVSAIAGAGLHVEQMREYPYSNGCQLFAGMRRLPGRRYTMPAGMPSMPLMLSIVAVHRDRPAPAGAASLIPTVPTDPSGTRAALPPVPAVARPASVLPGPTRAQRMARMRASGFDLLSADGEGY